MTETVAAPTLACRRLSMRHVSSGDEGRGGDEDISLLLEASYSVGFYT